MPHLVDDHISSLRMTRFNHPPYSPDLAPCDFFLFGYLKYQLEAKIFRTEEDLLKETGLILESKTQETLQRVFDEWITRLEACISNNGE